MSLRISFCWIFLNILLGFILFVNGEHFYLPKENNVFSNDLEDDWIPISGIDKRSTRQNHGSTQVVHITPPVRYSNRPLNQQSAASNKIEVFAQPPPTILGSFSEFGHATIEAREPAHTLHFRPSYNFDRHSEEINDRHFQQNDYHEPEDQKPPAIVVFNAQQRHPQNYHKLSPPPPPPPPQSSQPQQFYSNFQYHTINNNHNHNNNHNPNNNPKNFGFKEPPIIQDPPKRLPSYFVPNDHVYPRPQVNNKQVFVEQRPKPYLSSSVEPIQQPQQPFKSSPEVGSSGYFQKYPGHVESQNLFPQISNFARPFEQTNDHNVFIKPNQYVHNLNVGTEVRFGQDHGVQSTRPIPLELPTTGFTHPATRPFSKFQTPSPKNEELYRIFPVKEVNALPTFLPTPITLGQVVDGRPKVPYFKETSDGSSEYDAREEQDENESGEQYDIMKNPTKPMITSTTTTTTTTSTTTAPPRATRKRKPSTTTTTTIAPEEYEEYVVPNHSQNIPQGQDNQQEYNLQQDFQPQEDYRHRHEYEITSTTEVPEKPMPLLVNKYKKKKPFPSSRPKEAQQPSVEELDLPERMTLGQSPTATVATTITTTPATTTTTTTTSPQSIAETTATTDARAKIKLKYGNSSRPRFSIKDYKSVTTTTTTTEKAPSVASRRSTTTTPASADPETVEHQQTTSSVRKPYKPRVRPNRYKMSSTTTTTTEEVQQQETVTERVVASVTAYRSKYKPGKYYNRLRTSTESTTTADEGSEQVVATESTKPAVYSAKRRTASAGNTATIPSTVATVEESNALPLRRSSSISPPEIMDVASSEDVDYVATTIASIPLSSPKQKYHTSYVAERPLLPIESFFQSSMTSKRYHNERR